MESLLRITMYLALTLYGAGVVFGQDPPVPTAAGGPGAVENVTSEPAGRVEGPFELASEIFPGTTRNYWIYVPAQYDPRGRPACTLVVQDGLQRANEWGLPEVMDRLIAAGEMPVTIGIFVEPGIVPSPLPDSQPRFNRSFEYDSLGDRYARFVIEELLPPVAARYSLSRDPNDRAIAGASSGAICAFNVAWERPDAFRRVLSTIGTYVGLRGADQVSSMVRKVEPLPLRVFLEDGSNDLNIYAGDWWMANQTLLRALQWSGYEVEHRWGDGGHNGQHGKEIMPDALRWLWRGWPQPISVGRPSEQRVDVLLADQGWQIWSDGFARAEGLASDAEGQCWVCDPPTQSIYRLVENPGDDRRSDTLTPPVETEAENSPAGAASDVRRAIKTVGATDTGGARCVAAGKDGWIYYGDPLRRELRAIDPQNRSVLVEADTELVSMACLSDALYLIDPSDARLWRIAFDGRRQPFDLLAAKPTAIAISPDHSQIHLADGDGRFYNTCQRMADGSIAAEQAYGWFHESDAQTGNQCTAMLTDEQGHTYAATPLGIQIFDALGRVNLILLPPVRGTIGGMAWTGANRDYLTISIGDTVYRRQLKTRGSYLPGAPVNPPKPRL